MVDSVYPVYEVWAETFDPSSDQSGYFCLLVILAKVPEVILQNIAHVTRAKENKTSSRLLDSQNTYVESPLEILYTST